MTERPSVRLTAKISRKTAYTKTDTTHKTNNLPTVLQLKHGGLVGCISFVSWCYIIANLFIAITINKLQKYIYGKFILKFDSEFPCCFYSVVFIIQCFFQKLILSIFPTIVASRTLLAYNTVKVVSIFHYSIRASTCNRGVIYQIPCY